MRSRLLWFYLILAGSVAAWSTAGQPHRVHALEHATIYVSPGHVVTDGTIILRDGRVEAVGAGIAVPPDARVWDMSGKIIHAGFIDPYVTSSRLEGKPLRWPPTAADTEEGEPTPAPPAPLSPPAASNPNPRVHPDWRIVDHLKPDKKAVEALREDGFVLVQAVPDDGIFRGSAALYSLADAAPPDLVLRSDTASVLAFEARPDESTFPVSEMGMVALVRQTFSDATWYREARQLETNSYHGVHRPELDTGLEALQPVQDGARPLLYESLSLLEDVRMASLEDELHIGPRITVLSGEEWRHLDWLKGLPQGGLILPLKFPVGPSAKSPGEWLDISLDQLRAWKYARAVPRWLTEDHVAYALTTHRLKSADDFPGALQEALDAGLSEPDALAALTVQPAELLGISDREGTLDPGKAASLVVCKDALLGKKSKVQEVWIEGVRYVVDDAEASAAASPAPHPKKAASPPEFAAADYAARFVPRPTPAQHTVFVHGATIWTAGPAGVLHDADMIVEDGRIKAVGSGLTAPPGAFEIDGRGLQITPGLVDCHSHTAIDGDVNEWTLSCSSMARIKDVLNPFDPAIYLELAGGTTVGNVLHGSANAIGGQVVTCKWRYGGRPQDMPVAGAPEGIKFALGENPKRGNDVDTENRYPQSRTGVEAFIRERFVAAKEYRKRQQAYRPGDLPVRRDFSLDALLEVLDGKRYIHCHSYRQDEILMLMRLSEELGFKVRTFQHVLEGYKIAEELARYGVGASTFSDWWAYKYEVVDAIPYNAALMHDRGVLVSLNSDSTDLARRLNQEAAKVIRWGSLSETEALAMVTINPARQLGIETWVGSLEPGKDGDFVVWSDDPLTLRARCLQTWIDGRRYFDRGEDARVRAGEATERAALIDRLKAVTKP